MLKAVIKHSLFMHISRMVLENPNRRTVMKRFIASVVLAIALLTSGVAVTQYSMVGTAYANGGE